MMDSAEHPASCSQEHSTPKTLVSHETNQATADTKPIENLASSIDNITMNSEPVPKLAGASMTEFRKFPDLPLQLRTKILEVNMFQDPVVSDPRIIRIHLEWFPEEDECYSDHDPAAIQPFWAQTIDTDDVEDDVEYDPDKYRHMHVYADHVNFSWKIDSQSAHVIRRSQQVMLPYLLASKECRSIALKFLVVKMGRRKRAFRSPDLRWVVVSPTQDIFKIECRRTWEAVNEWGTDTLCASRDASIINHFMVDFDTFHSLVVPALREKDKRLLYVSNKEPIAHFSGESSMHAVFKNAMRIFVVADTDNARITTSRNMITWNEEDVQKEAVPGLESGTKEVMESVWAGKNTEFNGLHNNDGNLPMVLYVTVPDEKAAEVGNPEKAQKNGLGDAH